LKHSIILLILILTAATAHGQCTCSTPGSELIINGNFNSGDSGFSSSYFYESDNSNPGEHHYGIETNTSSMYGLWRDCSDHTSGTGNYMWIGPVLQLSQFGNNDAWEETMTVSKNTDYLFTMWSSTLGIDESDVFVLINYDTLIPHFKTPSAFNNCVWGKKCMTWNSGNFTSATIQIVPWYSGPFGAAAMAIDDLSFHSCNALSAIDKADNSFISVSPNPSHGVFNLYGNNEGDMLRISLTNIAGRELIYNEVKCATNENHIRLDFTAFDSGLYFLRVVTSKGIFARKICIQK